MRRLFPVGGLLAALALALPATAAARNVTVYAGGPSGWATSLGNKYGAGVNNFLINKVVINVGDTVTWKGDSLSGGFHTVDIPARHGSDLPLIKPTGNAIAPGSVLDAANQATFWFEMSGTVPELGFNTSLFMPIGTGTYNGSSRVDSGLPLGPPTDFTVTFTKAGLFKYFCDVHAGMRGEVLVKNKHAHVPTAKQNAKTLAKEERNYIKEAKTVLKAKVKKGQVSVGKSGPGGLEIFAMFPSNLTVKAGTTVDFVMSRHSREVHTASFGPQSYLDTLSNSFRGGPVPNQAAIYPSEAPGTRITFPGSHGDFASTGVMDRDKSTPTVPAFGAIKFTTPGTYNYECLIHSFMHGTIRVTP